ncbi:hypothetical protein PsYK624_079830 [Phanerochaete sordida]|uniref:RlpA-like protein double-psi beta-barrel domain-containing protein n=1 Tax=Phanerochaete sordida TaxID=48140 RepID=A0A9P3GBZ3_9APHY|nr:hypothetical protein PsYK624_079830 [Phanerochaete sordida]
MLAVKLCTSLLLAASMFSPILAAPAEPRAADVNPSGTHTGDGTWFVPGLGACGFTNTGSDLIVAVGHELFDTFPGYNGHNPNTNPICGRKITATFKGKSVTVKVVDRCVACNTFDLDFSRAGFAALANPDVGRIHGVKWHLD